MKKLVLCALVWGCAALAALAEGIGIPKLDDAYPRMASQMENHKVDRRLESYVERHVTEPEWIVSRLQMYWHSHADKIFIKGEDLDHVEGHAPVPTVRYPANRSGRGNYSRPKLEDVMPYQDSLGLWLINRTTGAAEWVDHTKAGGNVQSINNEIMKLARDAAYMYGKTGEEKYARFAYDIFDTFMTGLYYREVPYDLNHGHQQTLVGLTSFEVIHENVIVPAAETYDNLHGWLAANKADKMSLYEDTFRKWADVIVLGGVPHNNWNLIQAQFILRVALVLQDDAAYADGKGRQHYLNQILNESSLRQWSIGRLIDFGFDASTGIWKESPGYSTMVLSEFISFVKLIDSVLGIDLTQEYPVLGKTVLTAPQYLFPNGLLSGWGDTHSDLIRTDFMEGMAEIAEKHGGENPYSALVKDIKEGNYEAHVTPTFHTSEASWFVARSGMDRDSSLMVSVAGSLGNHAHANGISMELYGKGHILGPDSGRGSSYTSLDYLEYYSQFPAHNTVCVDGVSSYPEMMSQHGFELLGCYPEPQKKEGNYEGVLYGDFFFVEPESMSDQRRQLLIINNEEGNGYYVDVFRSRKQNGKDKMHDYFFHGLGQEFDLSVPTEPTEELAFAGGHIYAYSYLWDKSSAETSDDVSGCFTMTHKDGAKTGLEMWMRGESERTIFKAKSPMLDGLSRTPMPYDIKNSPALTFVARQRGEAWERPFVAVYKPYSSSDTAGIEKVSFAGEGYEVVEVAKTGGRTDYVFSADSCMEMEHGGAEVEAVLAVVSDGHYFMASGTFVGDADACVSTKVPATAALEKRPDGWYYCSSEPCKVKIEGKTYRLPASDFRKLL